MFDYSLYDYDQNNERHEAGLRERACLYRVTSLMHCSAADILTGRGPMNSPEPGRFNAPQQQTTYCSNNILVCFGEVLFHMYRLVLRRIEKKEHASLVRAAMVNEKALVIVRVKEIKDLVYMDSEGVAVDYDRRVCGAAAVFPDPQYEIFQDFNNKIRQEKKRGIIYPSARHSRDVCVALFHDETNSILSDGHEILNVRLQLVPEDQDFDKPPTPGGFSPFSKKIHPTMAYYEFVEPDALEKLRDAKLLNPAGIPSAGMTDFVRRRYRVYPGQAVCSF